MKKYLFAVFGALTLSVVTVFAQGATNAAFQLTPDQIAKLDNSIQSIVPLVPAKYQGAVASAIAILGLLAMAGRLIVGWKNNGLFGAFSGLFGGTNSSSANSPTTTARNTTGSTVVAVSNETNTHALESLTP